uniref:Uncharacterized protein n=1 Tax=Haplochromis burtoni TaxID=8153 RepID=A0A3Q2WP41_HAPBU
MYTWFKRLLVYCTIHPSIHSLPLVLFRVAGGAGAYPSCHRARGGVHPGQVASVSLCLSTDEAFEQGKTLPFINPSSLETLRALVQEIQSSGETDPEIWKDCEDNIEF